MNQASKTAEHEKMNAAGTSVVAAVGLTAFKIIVGALTGSLGILAEAAHSALDLVAAIVTWFAVRISGKPADHEHQYGHGKVENLSALFETLLLLVTCVWIIYEAVQRLFYKSVEIEVSIWSFLVMITSIVIDYTRSHVLYKAARKHNSQALEADALHFSTDIWSSSVVILGLIFVTVGEALPSLHFLKQADAVAAMAVAGIVVYVSLQLGKRTIQGLLDTAPKGMTEKITSIVEGVPGVLNCHHVRVRISGPSYFVDIHAVMDPNLSIVEAHTLTEKIEQAVEAAIPQIDVTVHPEPAEGETFDQNGSG